MKITEDAQEILEKLWISIIEDKKKFVGSNELSDKAAINNLKELQHINIKNGNISLTKRGELAAKKVIRRHRLAERLLSDVLDIRGAGMESSACKFEHILSLDVAENICTLLGHPKVCPHGKSIPPGKCCKEGTEVAKKVVSSLSRLHKGDMGRIAYIVTKNHKNLHKLISMGVLPGMDVEIIQTYPSYVFQVGNTQVAVDSNIADDIFVKYT
jgi:DtxR family Mn-dependent transcriptional regulator